MKQTHVGILLGQRMGHHTAIKRWVCRILGSCVLLSLWVNTSWAGDYNKQMVLTSVVTAPSNADLTTFSWATYPLDAARADTVIPCERAKCGYVFVYRYRLIMNPYKYSTVFALSSYGNNEETYLPLGATYGDAAKKWAEVYGATGTSVPVTVMTTGMSGYERYQICMLIQIKSSNYYQDLETNFTHPSGLAAGCSLLPPVPSVCEFSAATLTLDHGTLNSNSLNNASASRSLSVKCNQDTSMSFTVLDPKLALGTGLTSNLAVFRNGKQVLDTAPESIKGETSVIFDIKSTLSAVGEIKAGEYKASTVLLLNFS